jgi:ABC-type arginine transport system permease subunit
VEAALVEVVMLPEMLEAGMEALAESKKRKLTDEDVCVAVFLAMRAIEEIYALRLERGAIH